RLKAWHTPPAPLRNVFNSAARDDLKVRLFRAALWSAFGGMEAVQCAITSSKHHVDFGECRRPTSAAFDRAARPGASGCEAAPASGSVGSHAFAAQLIERGGGGRRGAGVLSLCVERWMSVGAGRLDWTAASSSLGDIDNTDTWQDDLSELAAAATAAENDWYNDQDFEESLTPVQELPVPELPLRDLLAEAPGPSSNGYHGGAPAIPFNRLVREATPLVTRAPTTSQRRRYEDSAYAGTPGYPTVEERKRMARRVARSLTDPLRFGVHKPINAMIDTSIGSADSRVIPLSSDAFLLPSKPKTVAEYVEQELLAAPKLTHTDYDPAKAFGLAAALRQGKAGQVLEKRRQRAEKYVVEGFGHGAADAIPALAAVAAATGGGDGGGLSELSSNFAAARGSGRRGRKWSFQQQQLPVEPRRQSFQIGATRRLEGPLQASLNFLARPLLAMLSFNQQAAAGRVNSDSSLVWREIFAETNGGLVDTGRTDHMTTGGQGLAFVSQIAVAFVAELTKQSMLHSLAPALSEELAHLVCYGRMCGTAGCTDRFRCHASCKCDSNLLL
uniref:HECT domain-containing protein n=1 Tax=Macrostomum lignano TaxID=282301 RepID=A0A1I8GHP6_9PLAT